VDGGTDRSGELERRARVEELVTALAGACLGELLQVEDLGQGHAHVADEHHVQLEHAARTLTRYHLDRVVVDAEDGDPALAQPRYAVQAETGLAGHECDGVAVRAELAPPASPEEQNVSLSDCHAVSTLRGLQIVRSDNLAGVQP